MYKGLQLGSTSFNQESIFLVGMMAVGKTTVGKMVAEHLGYTFYDTDDVIKERSGADIPWIFDVEGEQGFRDREQQVIEDLTKMRSIVLATGGGAVIRAENRRALASRGRVIYLFASLDVLIARASMNSQRPLLASHDVGERLCKLLRERGPLYSQIADICVESGSAGAQNTVKNLLRELDPRRNFV